MGGGQGPVSSYSEVLAVIISTIMYLIINTTYHHRRKFGRRGHRGRVRLRPRQLVTVVTLADEVCVYKRANLWRPNSAGGGFRPRKCIISCVQSHVLRKTQFPRVETNGSDSRHEGKNDLAHLFCFTDQIPLPDIST